LKEDQGVAELSLKISDPMDDYSAIEQLENPTSGTSHMLEHRSLKRLIDFLFLPSTHVMPNERIFAESLLLRDWAGIPEQVMVNLASRLANATNIAPRLALKLASCGKINISYPVLLFGELDDLDLVDIAHKGSEEERLIIARRNNLSPIVSALLVDIGSEEILKAVLVNKGAKISTRILVDLISKAKNNTALQNDLMFRPEMSAPEAMDLFWYVSGEVRVYVLQTYLCGERSLSVFLNEDSAWQEHQRTLCPSEISDERLKAITRFLVGNERENAIKILAYYTRMPMTVATRILSDVGGEAFLVAAKAMGASRAGLNEAFMRLVNTKPCLIGGADRIEPLRGLFDRLSREQALVALQYWNCNANKSAI